MRKLKRSRRGISPTIIIVAIILIVIIIIGSLYALQIGPFAPPVKTELIMGTTDSVESAIDPAQAYDFFGWEIIQNIGATLIEVEPGSAATADDYTPALATDWTTIAKLSVNRLIERMEKPDIGHIKYFIQSKYIDNGTVAKIRKKS